MKKAGSNFPWRVAISLGLALITMAIFWPVLTHGFLIYDDQQYVTGNPHVRAGLSWPGVVWAFKSFYASNWHPLTWVSHMLDCQFFGLKPAGHHLTNVLLHGLNTLLAFVVLQRLTGAVWRSATVAALFAWHPLHVESVAWVAERKDVLSAFFFLLTLWGYTRYAGRTGDRRWETGDGRPEKTSRERFHLPSPVFYLLALVFFALGLMSKPMLVTLPFVLLLLDYWPLKRVPSDELGVTSKTKALLRLFWEKVPFFVLAALACVLTVSAQGQAYSIVTTGALPVSTRIFHAAISYLHYLGATFVPRHLAVYYPYEPANGVAEGIIALAALVLITLLAFWFASRRPYLLMGWLWFLGMLVPVIGLVQVGDQAWADRYTYLPLIGVFIAIVWGGLDLETAMIRDTRTGTILAGAITVAVALALLSITAHQLRFWKSSRLLFEHAAAVTPNNAKAIALLGSLLAEEGKLDEATSYYRRALALKGDNPQAHFSMGKLLERQGRLNEAVAEYEQALWFKPLREETHILIGMILARQKNYPEAAAHYRAALEFNPESAAALNNLARLLHSEGRYDEAIEDYSRALKLDPSLAEAHNNLGVLLLQKGRVDEGVAQLRQAVSLSPQNLECQYNLGMGLVQQKSWSEATNIFERFVQSKSEDARFHCQFGIALARSHRTRDAMSQLAHALLRQPDFPQALDELSWILSTDPRPEFRNGAEAVRMAERACQLTEGTDAGKLKTLAAAYAEAGRFPEGALTAQKAQQLAAKSGQQDTAEQCRLLVDSFKSGQPWRDPGQSDANKP